MTDTEILNWLEKNNVPIVSVLRPTKFASFSKPQTQGKWWKRVWISAEWADNRKFKSLRDAVKSISKSK